MVLTRHIAGILVAVLAVVCAYATCAKAETRIAVLVSHDSESYSEALAGFSDRLKEEGVDAQLDVYPLSGDGFKAASAAGRAKQGGAALVFTLGELATQTALKGAGDIPVVAGMVLRADALAGASNATGVVLEYPLETQLDLLGEILPRVKTVGVIYSPSQGGRALSGARSLGRQRGLRIVLKEVASPQDLPSALDYMAKNAEAILAVNDSVVFTSQTAKHILLFSYRNRVPLIGLSHFWVKAGALYSLERDYKDIGAQCAEMAVKVLNGAQAGSIPAETPRKMQYCLNLKTARHMRVEIPEPVVSGASRVYKE